MKHRVNYFLREVSILILFFIGVYLLLLPPVSAGIGEETGAGMVAMGIDSFFNNAANDLGANGTNLNALSTYYDPLSNPVVRASIQTTSIFALTIFISYVLLAMSYLVLHTSHPRAAYAIDFMANNAKTFNLGAFVKKCFSVMALFVFGFLIMVIILQFAHALSTMMDTSSMEVVRSSSESGLMNFIYSIFWFIITVFVAIRNLIITFIFCFALLLITAWGFSIFQKPVEIIGLYFLVLAFIQPVLVGTAAIGIQTIDYLKNVAGGLESALLTLALLIVLVALSLIFIVGPIYFHELFFSLRKTKP